MENDKVVQILMEMKGDISSIKTDIENIKEQSRDIPKRLDKVESDTIQNTKDILEIQENNKYWKRTMATAIAFPLALFIFQLIIQLIISKF
ncbi:hemolysin XhlA family protein [Liquorilactobacillus hordei]|uniref:Uncharacterized protein n=1 Tax=Liquorilactobacillus hordei DSM 19519 TaxID=1423759 RepID=A0A0R1MUC6_9LACO|nr:hemolysin XhlA family protein [Liquorilactobacillus hordei]KRL07931.1 hypothetical protein FC92_GL000998 [Liquorilactobacillus hordei DSM 19519]QYH51123.1 hypothetical protein G6O70_00765 [Liquorilactobacillus hordei DSM 19519]